MLITYYAKCLYFLKFLLYLYYKTKIKMKKLLISAIAIISLSSCTENSRVKNFGGEGTINLPQGHKLVNVTWKENQIWYLSRPMHKGEVPETYKFQEESSWGVVEGTYNIIETK
jgi:hypothetical protein